MSDLIITDELLKAMEQIIKNFDQVYERMKPHVKNLNQIVEEKAEEDVNYYFMFEMPLEAEDNYFESMRIKRSEYFQSQRLNNIIEKYAKPLKSEGEDGVKFASLFVSNSYRHHFAIFYKLKFSQCLRMFDYDDYSCEI